MTSKKSEHLLFVYLNNMLHIYSFMLANSCSTIAISFKDDNVKNLQVFSQKIQLDDKVESKIIPLEFLRVKNSNFYVSEH